MTNTEDSTPGNMEAQEKIIADDGTEYPADVYAETSRAKYGSQQAAADAWAGGELPTHNPTHGAKPACVLYCHPNFKGYQLPDGSGFLKHYGNYEAIRTRSGLLIDNAECQAAGQAKCTPPRRSRYRLTSLPLTTLAMHCSESIFDIVGVASASPDEDETERNFRKVVDFRDSETGERVVRACGYGDEAVSEPLDSTDLERMFEVVEDDYV